MVWLLVFCKIDVNCQLQANGKQMLSRKKQRASSVTAQERKASCLTLSFTDSGIFETGHSHAFVKNVFFHLNESVLGTGSGVTAGSITHRFSLCPRNCSSRLLQQPPQQNRAPLSNRKALTKCTKYNCDLVCNKQLG